MRYESIPYRIGDVTWNLTLPNVNGSVSPLLMGTCVTPVSCESVSPLLSGVCHRCCRVCVTSDVVYNVLDVSLEMLLSMCHQC